MKLIRTEDAVGQILCHDITQIIKGVTKDARFRKGHIVTEEDIPVLLSLGKDKLYVWENDDTVYHENEAAKILCDVCKNDYMSASSVKEGKIELKADIDGLFQIDVERLRAERRTNTTFVNAQRRMIHEPVVNIQAHSVTPRDFVLEREVNSTPFIPQAGCMEQSCEEIFHIQTMGLAKRLVHTHCQQVVVGVSGGLDSTLALLVCARTFDMLGYDRSGIVGITMPGFGTTDRTYANALNLMRQLGVTVREISIAKSVRQHFEDIGHDISQHDVTYENSQARERTQILMDVANQVGGLVIGTGDLSELALGWCTYNGDHMSMYAVNAGVPKTLITHLVKYVASTVEEETAAILLDIVDTPISPELIPADEQGKIQQKTEDLVGPYVLHDFFLYYFLRYGFRPSKIFLLAQKAFAGQFADGVISHWLKIFCRRFFNQQFKRSCLPDGPKVGSVSLSPRGDWRMPSDAAAELWLRECESLG